MAHEPYRRIVSDSRRVIVMLHGIIGTPDHFRDFIKLVPADWSVYNLLLDGHGGSVMDFSHTSMEKWHRQVEQLLERLVLRYEDVFIAAHSMGTLFALRAALQHPTKITGLFLMNPCLQVGIKPLALSNAWKVYTGHITPTDTAAQEAQRACSITQSRDLWQYHGWLPRYRELLVEIRRVRPLVKRLTVPCRVYLSRHDELVSPHSQRWLTGNGYITCHFLEQSTHFSYSPADYSHLLAEFERFCHG